jgi:cation transport regulator ChaC
MDKNACVIALTEVGNRKIVFKNRDRNYVPTFKIYHVRAENGTEILYFQDTISGWVEGINEHGIAITNAALAVISDEKEGKKKRPGDRNRFSGDAWRFLKALECNSLLEALHVMTHHRNGVRGHNIITDGKNTFIVEQTSLHSPKVEEITEKHFVRTNHGIRHPDAGYLEGEDRESSETRYNTALKAMQSYKRSPMDLVKKLYTQRIKDIHNPFNVVRKTDNMFTSNQIILDPMYKRMTVVLIDEDSIYEGYEKHFKGKEKCKFCVKRIYLNDEGEVTLSNLEKNKLDIPLMAPHENTLKVFVYGSLMYEPIFPELITKKRRGHVNNLSRSFNIYSTGRKHLVLGTKPYGYMEGMLLEYPIEHAQKVLEEIDKREGYKPSDPSSSTYIRDKCYVFTKENPQGELCLCYITNEEGENYQGEISVSEVAEKLLANEEAMEYFEFTDIELKSIEAAKDKYLKKIKDKIKEIKRSPVE